MVNAGWGERSGNSTHTWRGGSRSKQDHVKPSASVLGKTANIGVYLPRGICYEIVVLSRSRVGNSIT